ncbi:histidinol-phosphate transaminase [Cupriavidus sp. L7L]|uniref:histidinol-phosphate transaminase n=1 Tax=Cupriavidus sp. L7L TaxID=2546443 RepID=UPI00105533D4|nr:histidinol-phosphate transaminase [Cupriavidus sp. L7L]TDF62677.1 histidinol-phosphate transaminase [Cupriavidus sp. L7L]
MFDFPDHIQKLQPYVPGLAITTLANELGVAPSAIVKVASNENPLGPSVLAQRALASAAPELALYPDNDSLELTQAIASFHGLPAGWVVVGSGSEAVLSMAAVALLSHGRDTVYSQYSFQAFAGAAQRVGATAVVVPSPDFKVDLDGLLDGINEQTSLVYIANPGNPTGTYLKNDEIESFLQRVPAQVVVLLDEAYFEYLPDAEKSNSLELVRRYPNLLVTRTFSKAYGLAGLRVGYGIAQPGIADMLRRVRAPFSVTRAAQICAAAALHDTDFLARTVACNAEGLTYLYRAFDELGVQYVPSYANFVLAKVGDGIGLSKRLTKRGVIVRPLKSYGLDQWIRISVGTMNENQQVVAAIRAELQTAR